MASQRRKYYRCKERGTIHMIPREEEKDRDTLRRYRQLSRTGRIHHTAWDGNIYVFGGIEDPMPCDC